MKYIKAIILTLLILVSVAPINVLALEQKGFQITEVKKSEFESYRNDYSVKLITEAPEKNTITCFDVNKNGLIAAGFSNEQHNQTIAIYDSNSQFKYGFSFFNYGTYYIEWNNDYLNVYYVREKVAATYDDCANLISVAIIDDVSENDSYWRVLEEKERIIGDTQYIMKNSMGIINLFVGESYYTQIIRVNNDGSNSLIYDVNREQLKGIYVFLIISVIFIFAVIMIYRKMKPKR